MFTLRRPTTDQEFAAYYDLRWRVLRQPWNQPRGSEKDEHESTAFHVAAYNDNAQLLGVGRLHAANNQEAQIRYMAVAEQARTQGVGRAIVERLEAIAREQSLPKITLNARTPVVGFYERLGYHTTGPGHTLFGAVEHVNMVKDLPTH